MAQIFERKNVLIAGGAGFIGSHLCDALVKSCHVICVDNFSTSRVDNIEQLLQDANFEFINHDITQPLNLLDYPELERFKLKFQGIQEIYHLACPISKRRFEDFKIATALTNSIGTKHLLDVAVAHKAKVLYASSSALYGPRRPGQAFVRESDACAIDHLTAFGAYDEGKRFSESLLHTYADVYGLDVKISRVFRTYGPRMSLHDGHLIPDMVHAALDNQEVALTADEEAKLSLCYVSDVVDGLIKQMSSPIDVRVVNIGSDEEHLLSRVAERIIRLTGATSRVRFVPSVQASPEAAPPDVGKARQVLHWLPLVRLDDGLKRMIEYAQSHKYRLTFHG